MTAEFTNATTTAVHRRADAIMGDRPPAGARCPDADSPQVVEPGTIVGSIGADAHRSTARVSWRRVPRYWLGGCRRLRRRRAFLSSGTWSLLGTELHAVITPRARELNFTNEGASTEPRGC